MYTEHKKKPNNLNHINILFLVTYKAGIFISSRSVTEVVVAISIVYKLPLWTIL
jgi:hypothetical protein